MSNEIISKKLLSEVLGLKYNTNDRYKGWLTQILTVKEEHLKYKTNFEAINGDNEKYIGERNEDINIHELAHNIIDFIVSNGNVASLVKIKEFWYCEFTTEHYYKNNGMCNKGNTDSDYDVNTKSQCPLESASIACQWIQDNRK